MRRRAVLSLGVAGAATAAVGVGSGVRVFDNPGAESSFRSEPARMADDVCESYLVNTKIFWDVGGYRHTDAVVSLLKELGVRTVRERLATGDFRGAHKQQAAMLELAGAGIRWHATVGDLESWAVAERFHRGCMSLLNSYYRPRLGGDLSSMLHSLGGCNEVNGPVLDGVVDPEWALHARIMQTALWTAAKGNLATRDIPIAGPSTRTDITTDAATALGDISDVCDLGNAHVYNRGVSPTRYIDDHLEILEPCFPDVEDWVITETGYSDSPQSDRGQSIPEDAVATYTIRGICDYFNRRATYGRFELLDDPDVIDFSTQETIDETAEWEAHFGMVAMTRNDVASPDPDSWRRKPEFLATKRLLALMDDRGPTFLPDPLRLSISGGGEDLQHALVQKRDGRHYLLVWRDVDVSSPFPDPQPLTVDPVAIHVSLRTARPVAVYSPRSSSEPVAKLSATTDFQVTVGGDLMVVEMG